MQLLERHIVTGKQILTILAICCLLLVIGFFVIPVLHVPREPAIVGMAKGRCGSIALFLKKYYAGLDTMGEKPQVSDVVKFIENQRVRHSFGLSSQAPVAPYLSAFDFGVYLLLPEKLESDFPTLIGYTSRIKKWKQERFFRIGLFLRGTDVVVVVLPSDALEKVVGEQIIKQAEPDIYYWAGKEQYLRDLHELKGTKKKSEAPF